MPSVAAMQRRLHAFRDGVDARIISPEEERLIGLFDKAERDLARVARRLERLPTDAEGRLIAEFAAVEQANRILLTIDTDITRLIRTPGKQWADNAILAAWEAGREAAAINVNVDLISQDLVRAAFENVTDEVSNILTVGFEDTYRIMNTVGDDVGEWFRRTTIDSIMEGIPVVGPGETLANRLVESGRIRPITVRSKTGRDIHLSLTQRAKTIARIEMVRVENRAHQILADEALGAEAVYENTNPQDSRTTDICERASVREAMSLDAWANSEFGRPPRLRPFHLCRSRLVGGLKEWFE